MAAHVTTSIGAPFSASAIDHIGLGGVECCNLGFKVAAIDVDEQAGAWYIPLFDFLGGPDIQNDDIAVFAHICHCGGINSFP